MASPPPPEDDARAGPSDLLLDLQLSSDDDDEDYQNLLTHLERQHAFQTRLLQQSGDTSIGTP